MAALCRSRGSMCCVDIYFVIFVFIVMCCSCWWCVSSSRIHMPDPRLEFYSHDVVYPRIFTVRGRQKREITPDEEHEDTLQLEMPIFGQNYLIHLHMNKDLLTEKYFEKYHSNGSHIVNRPYQEKQSHCHYQGNAANHPNSWAAISTCRGISGVFYDGNETYYIHPESSAVNNSHLVFKASDMKSQNFTCGYSTVSHSQLAPLGWKKLQRLKRGIVQNEPYKSTPKTRYVELLIVNDHKEYEKLNKDRTAVFERSKQIANIVNGLYSPFNIYITLVGVLVWSEYDEITLSSDGDTTLTNFLHYRRQRLAPFHPNDNAQLITGMTFDGGVVGKALKGPICTFEYSGGVNTDQNQVIALVATTVAHELGHNFGMEHDTDKCTCPDDRCIMAPSSSTLSPRHWSSCSYEHMREAYQQGMDYCLRNKPVKLFNGPVCGNGFLEEGEECDCGLKEFCDSQCCNASTCRLLPNATCATGSCCDMTTCQVKKNNELCRMAGTECDLPERCDGESEFCPEDVYAQNGMECGNGRAYCYEGQCRSHRDQCRLLWGETGQMSDLQCYNQNQNGNVNGNCGYNRLNDSYKACKKEDVLCGMLHCAHLNERLEFGMESAAILPKSFMHIKGMVYACRSAIIDLGLDSIDPGLVPSGAKCGRDSMCVNQKCVPVEQVKSPSCPFDCYGNGVCNNKGECYCINGFAPPYCNYLLPGAGYHITVAMYIIFLCILPLAAITVFIAYYFHEHIKTWWLAQARKAVIKSGAKQAAERKKPRPQSKFSFDRNSLRTVEISAPIPHESTIEAVSTISCSSEKRPPQPFIHSTDKPVGFQPFPTSLTKPVDLQTSSGPTSFQKLSSANSVTAASPVTLNATNPMASTTGNSKIVPTRAAPPPPRVRPQRTPSWAPTSGVRPGVATVTRTSSLRTTDGKTGRPLSISSARPTCPPPPRPPALPTAISTEEKPATESAMPLENIYDECTDTILDFSNTKLAFVHDDTTPTSNPKQNWANKPLPPLPNSNQSQSNKNETSKIQPVVKNPPSVEMPSLNTRKPLGTFLNRASTFTTPNSSSQKKENSGEGSANGTTVNEKSGMDADKVKASAVVSPKPSFPDTGQNRVKAITDDLQNKIPMSVQATSVQDTPTNNSFSNSSTLKPVKLSTFSGKPLSSKPITSSSTSAPTPSRTNSTAGSGPKPTVPPQSAKPTLGTNRNFSKPNNSSFLHRNDSHATRTPKTDSMTPSAQNIRPSSSFSSRSSDAKNKSASDASSSRLHPSSFQTSAAANSAKSPNTTTIPTKPSVTGAKTRALHSNSAPGSKPVSVSGSFRTKTTGTPTSSNAPSAPKNKLAKPETKIVGTNDKAGNPGRPVKRTNSSLVTSMAQKFEQRNTDKNNS